MPADFEDTKEDARATELESKKGRVYQEKIDAFVKANKGHMAEDHDGDPVYMTRLQWDIDRVVRDYPAARLTATKEMMA